MGDRWASLILLLILCLAVSSLIVMVDAEPSWVMWSQTYGGNNTEGSFHLVHLVETVHGEYALAGNTRSFGAGESDFWLVKTNEQGIPEFPSWTPMLLILIVLAVAVAIYKSRLDKK